MNFMAWLKGLIGASIGGAANTVTVMIVDPTNFNFETGMTKLAAVAAVGAVLSAAMYLKKSPIPE